MSSRGHEVTYLTSPNLFAKLSFKNPFLKKWFGYVDQFVVFPLLLRLHLLNSETDLIVICDQALGMWVPHVRNRPHVIHCMDFMALKSSLGEYPENRISWTGRIYQTLIKKGFCCGKNFLSISRNTHEELSRFLTAAPSLSGVAYLGLNSNFYPMDLDQWRTVMPDRLKAACTTGFFLHVGGNQWYKNRSGVLELYRSWCLNTHQRILPLWMVGQTPDDGLLKMATAIPNGGSVSFITDLDDTQIRAAYTFCTAMIFPSIAEGFGWPIAEAMACGAPVVTTDEAPMTEVGGEAAVYLKRRPFNDSGEWAKNGAEIMERLLMANLREKDERRKAGFLQSQKFDAERALDEFERVYVLIASKGIEKSL